MKFDILGEALAKLKLRKLNNLLIKNEKVPYTSLEDFVEYNYGLLYRYDNTLLSCLDAYIELQKG